MKILLIISGSIAAYKSLDLIRELGRKGHSITPILSKCGEKFITPLSVATCATNNVYTNDMAFDPQQNMAHITLSRSNDLILIAPASANIIAKFAHGIADELATTVLIAANIPIIIAPAMNSIMWQAKPVQRNISILKEYGIKIIDPQPGTMVCGEYGFGKMAEINTIIHFIENFFK